MYEAVSNILDPDHARHLVELIWNQTVCKGYPCELKQ